MMLSLIGCEFEAKYDPFLPDDPDPNIPTEFERYVKVVYTRNLDNVKSTRANWVNFHYELYDPKHERTADTDVNYANGYRYGSINMTPTGENSFECHLEHVLVQNDQKHKVFAIDVQLYEGYDSSMYTSEDINIQSSYDEETRSYYYCFRQLRIQ